MDATVGELAYLKEGLRHPLSTETVVGRGPSADLRLPHDFVSSLHAALTWASGGWTLRDLGSHNGTGVNGEALAPGVRARLKRGDEITFGQASATWTLVDDGEPVPFAITPGRAPVAGANGLLVLPDADTPEATVFAASSGGWRIEDSGEDRDIRDGETLTVAGTTWTIRLPAALTSTRTSIGSRRSVSLREVALSIVHDDDERGGSVVSRTADGESFSFPVGTNLDVLKILARARIADDSGWIDRERVLDALGMTGNRLNVSVFRLRRLFADAGFVDAAQIIERGHRRLRLGVSQISLDEPSRA